MAYSTVTSSAGNRDLDAGYTVSLTNSGGSGDCRVELAIGGASTNQLHTDGQLVTLTFKIDSRFVQQIDWTIPSGSLKAFRPASPIFVGTGKTLTVLIESSNSNDTAVEVVATLLDAQLQSKAQADSDQDDLETAIGNVPSATENGTAAAAAIERADGMLKKVPKIGDQVRRINQLNKHVDETLAEVPE